MTWNPKNKESVSGVQTLQTYVVRVKGRTETTVEVDSLITSKVSVSICKERNHFGINQDFRYVSRK